MSNCLNVCKLGLLYVVMLCFTACQKSPIEISELHDASWKLVEFGNDEAYYNLKRSDYASQESYRLSFSSDSSFNLNTSVNTTFGRYFIVDAQTMDVAGIIGSSLAGTIDEEASKRDDFLTSNFRGLMQSSKKGQRLTLEGPHGTFVFKKE